MIFWSVTVTSVGAMIITLVAIPYYNGHTIDAADTLAGDGKPTEAVKVLFSGPLNYDGTKSTGYEPDDWLSDEESQPE
jgi:hypothetical protein